MAEANAAITEKPGGGMTLSGALMVIAGVGISIFAYNMSTSIPADALPGTNPYLDGASSEVVNMDLQQQQLLIFMAGLACALGGLLLFASGRIVMHLTKG